MANRRRLRGGALPFRLCGGDPPSVPAGLAVPAGLGLGLLGPLALGVMSLLGTNCSSPPATLVIVQNQLVVPNMDTGACTPTTDVDSVRLQGTFDVDLDRAYPYYVYPLLESRLPSLKTTGGIERNSVLLTSLRIEVRPPAGLEPRWPAGCPATFDAPAAVVLDPQESRALVAEGLQPCHAQHLKQLIADGRFAGDGTQPVYFTLALKAIASHNGTTIESDAFPFQVRVCAGCLQSMFPATPLCNEAPKPNPRPGNPCNPAQDGPQVLCCADGAGALVCPAPDA